MPATKKRTNSPALAIAHEINTAMGKEVLKRGTDSDFAIRRIPSGSLTIDRITGGGFVAGRHVELYGDESGGKSYVAYRTMALAQSRGEVCALIDPEHSYDSEWFAHLGGDPNELLLEQPDDAEDAVASMMLLAQKRIGVCTLDSIASLVTKEEMGKDPREGDDRVASQARMMSRALRRITTSNRSTLFIWTNQEMMQVGIMFGNPKATKGGRSMRYYATTRIEMRRQQKVTKKRPVASREKLVQQDRPIGHWVQVRAEKEKSTKPYGQGSFIFDTENGCIDEFSEILQLGLEDKLITRSDNTFTYEGIETTVKGDRGRFRKAIMEDDDLYNELVDAIEDQTIQLTRVD